MEGISVALTVARVCGFGHRPLDTPRGNVRTPGICFLGKLKFDDFVGHHLGENPGEVPTLPSPLASKPQTRNPGPNTISPGRKKELRREPWILNSKALSPETGNPKPET